MQNEKLLWIYEFMIIENFGTWNSAAVATIAGAGATTVVAIIIVIIHV